MKNKILVILICGFILVGIIGCGENKNAEHSFYGKVLEVSSSYIIVEPNENEEERKSSDKFHIDLKNDDITYEVGTKVKITYNGGINESYPAQIGTTKIEIVENKDTNQHYSKVIDNIKLEFDIPNEWKYEEMQKNEADDTYALKLYKNNENQYAILSFDNNEFFVCGTGRTSTTIILNNGEEAIIGYYDGNKDWWDISFDSNRHLAFINHGLENSEAEEFLEFVKTINIEQN